MEIALKKRKVPNAFKVGKEGGKVGRTKSYTRGPSGRVRQLEYLLSLGRLNAEDHSPFYANGIRIYVHVSKLEYLRLGNMTEAQFDAARVEQQVPFVFI
jgi:hypothetical protein